MVAAVALDDPQVRKILATVASERRVRFREVLDQVQVERSQLRDQLDALHKAHLIDQRPAPVEDFSLYFITAEGLEAERQLRRSAGRAAMAIAAGGWD